MQVVALIHEGNGEFAAAFPDFPGAVAVAGTVDALIAEAARVLAAEVDAMIEDGLDLPRARSLSDLADDPAFREDSVGAMVALVPCAVPADMVRVAIAIDRGLLADIDRAAQAAAETRSRYIGEAVRRRLEASGAHGAEEPAQARPDAATPPGGPPADVRHVMESIRRSLATIDQTPIAAPESPEAAEHRRG